MTVKDVLFLVRYPTTVRYDEIKNPLDFGSYQPRSGDLTLHSCTHHSDVEYGSIAHNLTCIAYHLNIDLGSGSTADYNVVTGMNKLLSQRGEQHWRTGAENSGIGKKTNWT